MVHAMKIRNRGVRLNDHGLNVVQATLRQQWAQEAAHTKLTRERKAQLMGLSIATSDKVLKGDLVDRATLLLVFNSLNIEWKDEYLSLISAENNDAAVSHPIAEHTYDSNCVSAINHSSTIGSIFSHKVWRWLAVGFVALGFIAATVWSLQPTLPTPLAGQKAFHAGQFASATKIVTSLRTNSQASDSTSGLIEILRLEGDLLVSKGEYAQAKDRFSQALEIKQSLGIKNTYASSFEAIADCHLHLGELQAALNMFGKSLNQYSQEQDAVGVVMAKRGIASAYIKLGKIQYGLSLLNTCREDLRNCPAFARPALEADLLGRQAIAYSLFNSHQSAISLAEKSLTFWQRQKHPRWVAVCESQLGFIYRRSGNEPQASEHLKKSKLAFQQLGDSKTMDLIRAEMHLAQ